MRSWSPSTRSSTTSVDRGAAAERYLPAAWGAVQSFPIVPRDLKPVWISENVTFRVTDDRDGGAYVLRLHRPGYHGLDALNSERAWTEALARAGVGAPVGLRTREGVWFVPVAGPDNDETRYAGMASWTEGEVLSDLMKRENAAESPGRFRQLGAAVAALHNQAGAWTLPAGFTRHALDTDGLMGEAPWWGQFWDSPLLSASERSLAATTRLKIAAALDRLGRDRSIFSLIHADLHPDNVLVSGDRLTVIDFDDAAFGWHAYDLAVAIFHLQPEPNFAQAQAALMAGYRSARALSADTEALIPMFLLIRGLAVIGWLSQRPEHDPAPFLASMKGLIMGQCEAFPSPT